MKNTIKWFGIIVLLIGLSLIACDDGGNGGAGHTPTPTPCPYNGGDCECEPIENGECPTGCTCSKCTNGNGPEPVVPIGNGDTFPAYDTVDPVDFSNIQFEDITHLSSAMRTAYIIESQAALTPILVDAFRNTFDIAIAKMEMGDDAKIRALGLMLNTFTGDGLSLHPNERNLRSKISLLLDSSRWVAANREDRSINNALQQTNITSHPYFPTMRTLFEDLIAINQREHFNAGEQQTIQNRITSNSNIIRTRTDGEVSANPAAAEGEVRGLLERMMPGEAGPHRNDLIQLLECLLRLSALEQDLRAAGHVATAADGMPEVNGVPIPQDAINQMFEILYEWQQNQ